MKRHIISLSDAQKILKPYYEDLSEDINGGIQDYLEIKKFVADSGKFVEYETRTKASLIHDHIKARVIKRYSQSAVEGVSHSVVEARKWNGIFGLRIKDDLFIRFKKLNKAKCVAGLPTKQHVKFMCQALIDGFPDEPTFLFAGYIPNKTWTGIQGIYIACWNGRTIEWFDELGVYNTEQLNLLDNSKSDTSSESLIKPKKKGKKDASKSSDEGSVENTGTND